MPTNTCCSPSLVCASLLLFLGTTTSCRTKHRGVHYSQMQVVGESEINLVVDSLHFDPRTAPNPFYMELMTEKDTFLVRATARQLTTVHLSFPKLVDSLTQVNLYYNDWYGTIRGATLRSEYQALYFPNRPATIVIDTPPFEYPMAKKWVKQQKERIYCEIRFPQSGRVFSTSLVQDKRVVK